MVIGYHTSPAGGLVLIAATLVLFVLLPLAWWFLVSQLGVPADDSVPRRGPAGWLDRRRRRAASQAHQTQSAKEYARRRGGDWPVPPADL